MKIEDQDSPSFREEILNFWANYKQHKQYVTLGALLFTIKSQKLYKKWGHKTFFRYCRDELHLVPTNIESIYVVTYLRLAKLGLSPDEIRGLEKKTSQKRLFPAAKLARTRAKLFLLCSGKIPMKDFRHRQETVSFGPFTLPTVDLLNVIYKKIGARLGCQKGEVPIVVGILALLMVNKQKIKLERTVKRICRVTKLSEGVDEKILEVLR